MTRIIPTLLLICALLHAEDRPDKKPFPARPATAEVDPPADQKATIAKLIDQLGAAEFDTRISAEAELRKLGQSAIKQLRAAQASDDVQVRTTASKLIRESQSEVWEGYYFYSLQDFETAVAANTRRVRFWFTVSRNDDGTFSAHAGEQDEALGPSIIDGKVDRESGEFSFNKKYVEDETLAWRYEGNWNAEKQRIEGTYGPGSGGFVLFPRKLSEEDHKRYDQESAKAP